MTGGQQETLPAGGPGPAQPPASADDGGRGGRAATIARRLGRQALVANESWTIAALVIIMVAFTITSPGTFLTAKDMSLIAENASPLLVMAVGQTFVILTAGIDLSVGSILIFSSVIADEYYSHQAASAGWGVVLIGVVLGVAAAAAWGFVQGFAVAKMQIPPLIATLGGFGAALGASYLITGGTDLGSPPAPLAKTIGLGSVAGVSWLIVISFAVTLVFGLILAYTRFGRYTYAIGSNPEAGRRAGINVDWHLIKVYVLAGALSGVAGILSLAFNDGTTITGHPTDNLTVITGVVLGGASLFGGRGSMFGTLIGIFIPQILNTGLEIAYVNEYWQQVAIGLILVGAVYLDRFRRRLRERAA